MNRGMSTEDVLRGSHCGHAGVVRSGSRTTAREDLFRGVWRENPVLRQAMGLCPALAVTNTVANSLAMGIATLAVITGSSLLVSTFKNLVPYEVRITAYVLIIATFVTIVEMVMAAVVPEVNKALGAFVYLIVVNCMILGRQEAFASRRPVGRSVLDALGTGFGFLVALLMMGSLREVLGSGTFLGLDLFGPSYEPWVIMVLPAGGFFTIGIILLGFSWYHKRQLSPSRLRERSRQLAGPSVRGF